MHIRGYELFDETNKEHREDYNIFIRTGGFGKCKNRYRLLEGYDSIVEMMKDKVCRYYLTKEFG